MFSTLLHLPPLDVCWLRSVWLLMSFTPPSCQRRLNNSPKRCRTRSLSQREQLQQFYVCLLVGDSTETCGHAAANAEPRAGDQYCQTSSSRAGTGEEVCHPPAERNPPKRDRERRRIWLQRMRMQWEGDVAVETARRQKQTGGKTVWSWPQDVGAVSDSECLCECSIITSGDLFQG